VSILSTAIFAIIWPQKPKQGPSCQSAHQLRALCIILISARCRSWSTKQFVDNRKNFSLKNPLSPSQKIWGVPPISEGPGRKNFLHLSGRQTDSPPTSMALNIPARRSRNVREPSGKATGEIPRLGAGQHPGNGQTNANPMPPSVRQDDSPWTRDVRVSDLQADSPDSCHQLLTMPPETMNTPTTPQPKPDLESLRKAVHRQRRGRGGFR